jgi:hypothetical protein
MPKGKSRTKLDQLLKHLYHKKQWLDIMIASLESATRSPEHQLILSVTQAVAQSSLRKPTVDLDHQQKLRLARLANQVRRDDASRRSSDRAQA